MKLKTGFGNDFLRFGGLKGFADGSLGSATAYFFEPYADDPKAFGLLASDMIPKGPWRSGSRPPTGRASNAPSTPSATGPTPSSSTSSPRPRRRTARATGASGSSTPSTSGRPTSPASPSSASIASVQPYHAVDDGRWAEGRSGRSGSRRPIPSALSSTPGATLAFGSDWPVAPMDPLLAIDAAVNRRTLDGANPNGWVPEQKITVAEAVRASHARPRLRGVRRGVERLARDREGRRSRRPGRRPVRRPAGPAREASVSG